MITEVIPNSTRWCLALQSPYEFHTLLTCRSSIHDVAIDNKDILVSCPVESPIVITPHEWRILVGIGVTDCSEGTPSIGQISMEIANMDDSWCSGHGVNV